MVTGFGKLLRKIRIDNGEVLKDMANKLNVTSSYLSAVENGKRKIPASWVGIIAEEYNLSQSEHDRLLDASVKAEESIRISFKGASESKLDAAVVFARAFDNMDDDLAAKIKEMISQSDVKGRR